MLTRLILFLTTILPILCLPAYAQSYAVGSSTGYAGGTNGARQSVPTGPQETQMSSPGQALATDGTTWATQKGALTAPGANLSTASGPILMPTYTTQYGIAPGITTDIQHLPPTVLDSFVYNAPNASEIYGDEGTTGLPPIGTSGEATALSSVNTIGSGIVGTDTTTGLTNNPWLSTGHASTGLPSAWLDTQYMTATSATTPITTGSLIDIDDDDDISLTIPSSSTGSVTTSTGAMASNPNANLTSSTTPVTNNSSNSMGDDDDDDDD